MTKATTWVRSLASLLVAGAAVAGATSLLAQQTTSAGVPMLDEVSPAAGPLDEINASLERIAVALEAQHEERSLEILMKRIELSERRLLPMEARLRELRSERESLESQKGHIESSLLRMAERVEAGESDRARAQREQMTAQMELEAESVDGKISNIDDELSILENEAARQRRDVEDWQAYVDRRLSDL